MHSFCRNKKASTKLLANSFAVVPTSPSFLSPPLNTPCLQNFYLLEGPAIQEGRVQEPGRGSCLGREVYRAVIADKTRGPTWSCYSFQRRGMREVGPRLSKPDTVPTTEDRHGGAWSNRDPERVMLLFYRPSNSIQETGTPWCHQGSNWPCKTCHSNSFSYIVTTGVLSSSAQSHINLVLNLMLALSPHPELPPTSP